MLPTMKVIFEVDSLVNASPATISRCGMVYLVGEENGIFSFSHHFKMSYAIMIYISFDNLKPKYSMRSLCFFFFFQK